MNTNSQGNLGLGKAIQYFTSHNITLAIPLNDTQPYDLIADFNGKLQRISVKTGCYSETEGSYQVLLKHSGGGSNKINYFDNTSCDYVFIYTLDEQIYLIPAKEIDVKSSITVGRKYTEYQIKVNSFEQFKKL